jgi:hypothetical protein
MFYILTRLYSHFGRKFLLMLTLTTQQLEEKRQNYGKLCYDNYFLSRKSFNHKMVVSGKTLEFYRFNTRVGQDEVSQRQNFQKRSREVLLKTYRDNPADFEKVSSSSFRRSRGNIMRLVDSNEDFDQFITLTFDESKFLDPEMITNIIETNKLFKKFIMRLNYELKKRKLNPVELKYIGVPEYQGDHYFKTGEKKAFGGAVHYHLLVNFKMTNQQLSDIWGHGFVKIERIKHVQNVGFYISKYIGKDLFDLRLFGRRKVLYSKNLLRPVILTGIIRVKKILDSLSFYNLKPVFEKSYKNFLTKTDINYYLYKIESLALLL